MRINPLGSSFAAMALIFAICMGGAHAGDVAGESDHHPSACVVCLAAAANDDEQPPLTVSASLSRGRVVGSTFPSMDTTVTPSPRHLKARAPPVDC